MAEKKYNIRGLKNILQRAWDLMSFKICKMEHNIFHVFFTLKSNMGRVLEKGPWNVEDHRVIISPWNPLLSNWEDIFGLLNFGSRSRKWHNMHIRSSWEDISRTLTFHATTSR